MSRVQPPAQTQVTCEIRPNCSALFSRVLQTCKTETAELLWATTSTAWLNHVEEVLHPVWTFFTPTYDHWLLSSHHTAQKRALLHLLEGTSRLLLRSPWSLLFSCQTNSALSLSSQDKCSSSLTLLLVLHWTHFSLINLPCIEGPKTAQGTVDVV